VNRLEERYRRVLRVLPADYRARWEEEMVEAYLASVETDDPDRAEFLAEFGRPSLPEVYSVVALSVWLRLGLAGSPSARSAAWGGAVRFVALAWVLVGAATATVLFLEPLWMVLAALWPAAPPVPYVAPPPPGPMTGLAGVVWQFAPLGWIVAFAALLLGRPRLARIIATVLVARAVAWVLASLVESVVVDAATVWGYAVPMVVLHVGLLPTLWAFRPGDRPRGRPWLLAFAAGVAVLGLLAAASYAIVDGPVAGDHVDDGVTDAIMWAAGDHTNLYVIVAVIAAVLHLSRGAGRDPAGSLRLAVLVGVLLGLRLATLPLWMSDAGSVPTVAIVVEVVLLMLVALPLVRSASGRRLGSSGGGAAAARTP
jgi:hypothetical protein